MATAPVYSKPNLKPNRSTRDTNMPSVPHLSKCSLWAFSETWGNLLYKVHVRGRQVQEAIKSRVGAGVVFEGSSKEAQISNVNQGCRDTERIFFFTFTSECGNEAWVWKLGNTLWESHRVGAGPWGLVIRSYPPRHLAGPCFLFYV